MNLKKLELKTNYETGVDNLVEDFYIPILKQAIEYDRIAGFFSSTSLAISARGIEGLINNNGKMRLIISPQLSPQDINSIELAYEDPEEILSNSMIKEMDSIEDFITKNYVYALGWLIARQLLEIKVAIVCNEQGEYLNADQIQSRGIFHQKVGIIKDTENNIISFSGSINETAGGWINNVEEFKVFKYWEEGQREYCDGDIRKFDEFWNNKRHNVKIIDMPQAVNNYLIKKAPQDINEIININKYIELSRKENLFEKLSLFDYQLEAVEKWMNNDKKLVCEMATGTGKTRTAIGCMIKAILEDNPIIIFITCPQNALSLQWKSDIEEMKVCYDAYVIVDSSNRKWRSELEGILLDVAIGLYKTIIVYTTHKSFSSNDFIRIVMDNKKSSKYMLIGDEVHGLGAGRTSRGLINDYDYRLGLSATPKRWYDEEGTKIIYDFFSDEIFEFSIQQALNTINPLTGSTYLTNYLYFPMFCTLNDEELEDYAELSLKILKMSNYFSDESRSSEILENLLFKRATIHKSAINKYGVFNEIINEMDDINDTIIFVSPEQIDKVTDVLSMNGIKHHRFTQNEENIPKSEYGGLTERQYIIGKFKEKRYQVLVAIKCLDEGIDIPSAETAILLASSTNPREYIQRIGRVIRRYPGKSLAIIYDVIIKPDFYRMNSELLKLEMKIFSKEMERTLEIAKNALNNTEAIKKVYEVLEEGKKWG